MSAFTANKNAFEAYNILYYPMLGAKGMFNVSEEAFNTAVPQNEDWAYALTIQENLGGSPYRLSQRAVTALAKLHRVLSDVMGVAGTSALNALLPDPASDVMGFLPPSKHWTVMYPGFPTQVLEMDEADFRLDQARHYASTYGVELISAALGIAADVGEGWLPSRDEEERPEQEKNENVPDHLLEVALCEEQAITVLDTAFARPARMPEAALKFAAELAENGYRPGKIAFHENMMGLIWRTTDKGSQLQTEMISHLAQHPGDVLKSAAFCADANCTNHLTTAQKKAHCRAMENFDREAIARNIVDNGTLTRRAVNLLSAARFAGERLTGAIEDVETRKIRSWNSELEELWGEYKAAPSERTAKKLLSRYAQRPGIMLRSLTRLVDAGIPERDITQVLEANADALSMATLVTIQTVMTGLDIASIPDWNGHVTEGAELERLANRHDVFVRVAKTTLPILSDKMSKLVTPIRNKKVYVDPCGFSLQGSVVLPNLQGGATQGAYPPAGMAYALPESGTVRFFTFWDDRRWRVDVDLHFHAFKDADDEESIISIGWNSDYKKGGMVTSGDITTSHDSAEYLDLDLTAAEEHGVKTVFQQAHIYDGAYNWSSISTCFSGAMLVGSVDAKVDPALYKAENIIFHDDMNGEGRQCNYAMIDVPNRYVRILRDAKIPFKSNIFTLDVFIKLLAHSQNAEIVDDPNQADVVLAVGRSDDASAVSLIDNGFFVQ